ncbi:unnamed protein product [Moneuplotes crassus]|uniref:Large ribosomal subunit protein uL24c n=1 Tax=Euplotes crassus TaxID=5936 RepID=A0AAD1XZL0_EUPCR|nr:unnamed protein product [Moneuplotes crassus]
MRRSLVWTPFRMFAHRPAQIPFKDWKIVSHDIVQVISGKSKGKQGKVLKVFRKTNQVLVEGVNYKFKKVEDDEFVTRMKTVQQEYPIHVSNVALIDPETGKPTRVKYVRTLEGKRVRIAKSGAMIPKPEREELKYVNRTKSEIGPLDTMPEDVIEKTYKGEDFVKIKKEFEEFLRIKAEKERNLVFGK